MNWSQRLWIHLKHPILSAGVCLKHRVKLNSSLGEYYCVVCCEESRQDSVRRKEVFNRKYGIRDANKN